MLPKSFQKFFELRNLSRIFSTTFSRSEIFLEFFPKLCWSSNFFEIFPNFFELKYFTKHFFRILFSSGIFLEFFSELCFWAQKFLWNLSGLFLSLETSMENFYIFFKFTKAPSLATLAKNLPIRQNFNDLTSS